MARLILLLCVASAFCGCGRVWLPESLERRAGNLLARGLAEEMPPVEKHPWDPFLQDAGRKLAAVSDRPSYGYRFRIVRSAQINAFALPNGEIFVTEGLLKAVGRDGEALASVLGHEIGHVARRHTAESLQSKIGLRSAGFLLFGVDQSLARVSADLAAQLTELGYGREMELEADLCAIRYLARLGYPPETGLKFLKILAAKEGDRGPDFLRYFMTHPPTRERVEYAEKYAKSLPR